MWRKNLLGIDRVRESMSYFLMMLIFIVTILDCVLWGTLRVVKEENILFDQAGPGLVINSGDKNIIFCVSSIDT